MTDQRSQVLDFALGPVQTFVGQARRTRDLWGGSFLLSFLAGHAMAAVRRQGGRIAFPAVEGDGEQSPPSSPLLCAIENQPLDKDPAPHIGTLPNRFRAEVGATFDPSQVVDAINHAWSRIADAVRSEFVDAVATNGNGTEDIWRRQIDGFWETAWVLIGPEADPADPRARKHWRKPASLTVEGGDHCTVMHDLQELSGYTRAEARDKKCRFWRALREVRGIGDLDLREDEQLCAIALVKRLFPRVARKSIGWDVDVRNWPSTAYTAAVPWIERAGRHAPQACASYAKSVHKAFAEGAQGERKTKLKRLEALGEGANKWTGLDGNAFHANALANERITPLKHEDHRQALMRELTALNATVGGEASSYYALLLMDGDRVGELLRAEEPARVSRALAAFGRRVPERLSERSGMAVYAGGDDVLALLPVDEALAAARDLETAYRDAFRAQGIDAARVGLSGGIVYAHYKQPLATALTTAHRLLDDTAKAGNGGASVALGVLQSVGVNLEWVTAFGTQGLAGLHDLINRFQQDPGYLPGRFVNGLQNLFGLRPETEDHVPSELPVTADQLADLLTAQLHANREQALDQSELRGRIQTLVPVLRRYPRDEHGRVSGPAGYQPDGARMARFLAQAGGAQAGEPQAGGQS